jgi:hypothetical protein
LALLPFGFGDDALELAGHSPAETKQIIVAPETGRVEVPDRESM